MQLARMISFLLLGIVIPCTVAAPVHSSDIVSTIKGIRNKIEGNGKSVTITENESSSSDEENEEGDQGPVLMPDISMRQNKMFGFYGYIPAFAPIPAYYPTLPPTDYFSDYSYYGYNDEDEDVMSRGAGGGTKKRPSNQFKNSPIYYIRLPPTPYMFVPGIGYVSQPPTYQPMAPIMPPVVPAMPAMPGATSPFYNLPLNFMANGKPTNIYQWQGNPQIPSAMPGNQYGMQMPGNQFGMQAPGQFGMAPQASYNPQMGGPQMQQMPSPPHHQQQQPPVVSQQRPHKPYRPYPRPQNTYMQQDSKVTHLKGPFLFNGRPEDIYLLSNYQNLQNPYNAAYYPDPYSYNNYNPYNGYY